MSEKTSMFELLNERLSEEEIIKITTSYDNKFNELEEAKKQRDEEIQRLNNQLQQKENIIKEVREYIEERYNGEVLTHTFDKDNVGELLNILKEVIKSE